MGTMKPLKRSVAVVIGRPGGEFLIVRRPDDPDDPLAGAWGLPAITLLDDETKRAGVVRAGRVKLGVELAAGPRIGEKTADHGGYVLRLADYAATVLAGVPAVPQPDDSMTQYTACRYAGDPGTGRGGGARLPLRSGLPRRPGPRPGPRVSEDVAGRRRDRTGGSARRGVERLVPQLHLGRALHRRG